MPVSRFDTHAVGFSWVLRYNVKRLWEGFYQVDYTEIVVEERCSALLAVGRGRMSPYEMYH